MTKKVEKNKVVSSTPAASTSSPASTSSTTNTDRMPEETFRQKLLELSVQGKACRRTICTLYTVAVHDLLYSKSCSRVNQVMQVLPHAWSALFIRAIHGAAGGYAVSTSEKSDVDFNRENSKLTYKKGEFAWKTSPQLPDLSREIQFFRDVLEHRDFDCIISRNTKTTELYSIAKLVKYLENKRFPEEEAKLMDIIISDLKEQLA